MTRSKRSLLALACTGIALAGCPVKTGDSGPATQDTHHPDCQDADGDGHDDQACGGDDCDDGDARVHPGEDEICEDDLDNDCDGGVDDEDEGGCEPERMQPTWYAWGFEGGIIDGEAVRVDVGFGELRPTIWIELYEEEYLSTSHGRYSCMIAYEPILGPGNSNPDAWLDFVFLPDVHYYTDCDRLDPDIFGDDPYALFDNTTWEVVIDPLGAELQELFIETVGEEEWEESCEPYVFGAQVHEDGNSPEVSQTHWGWTLEVYGGALGEELLEVEQIAQGANGFFIVQPAILWPL